MISLIDEIDAARRDLLHREKEAVEASRVLRACKAAKRQAKAELDVLLEELCTGESRYPLLGFDPLVTPRQNGNGTHDEFQRGPTEFAEVPSERAGRTRKASAQKTGRAVTEGDRVTGGRVYPGWQAESSRRVTSRQRGKTGRRALV
jgi:hypothetical protein